MDCSNLHPRLHLVGKVLMALLFTALCMSALHKTTTLSGPAAVSPSSINNFHILKSTVIHLPSKRFHISKSSTATHLPTKAFTFLNLLL
jgi:hypothetical protein